MTKLKQYKWYVIGGFLVLVLIAGGFFWLRGDRNESTAAAGEGEIVTAFMGDLSGSATASGELAAQREARLAMAGSGSVESIFFEVGDHVTAGDPLLRLDTADLDRAVASAEQALRAQEANLARLTSPPSASDLAAAEAAVASAQAQLDDLRNSPTDDDIAASEANLRAAQANVRAAAEQVEQARQGTSDAEIASAEADLIAALGNQEQLQDLYDRLIECFEVALPNGEQREICPGLGNPEEQTRYNLEVANANVDAARAALEALQAGPDSNAVAVAQASLATAVARRDAAQANHDLLLQGAGEAQIANAVASLAQAEANLAALQEGASQAQITTAEVQVEQARINLARAQRNLEEATLRAPFDGVVTALRVSEGEQATGVVAEMTDFDSLEVLLDVDEIDMGQIAVGQPASVTLESWPDEEIAGEVVAMAPAANNDSSALVSYTVNLALADTDLPLRVGLTANASLVTANRENVLLLPSNSIRIDRSAGTFSVNLVQTDANGEQTITEVPVTIGLRDGQFTQITGGLQAGDQVLIGNAPPRQQFGNGPFNGG